MKTLFLQLSDIHFWDNKHNSLAYPERVKEIVKAVQGVANDVTTCFVIFTGDAAQSGTPKEYEMAHTFFGTLISGLQESRPEWQIEQIYIPGNHDCVLSEDDLIRNLTIKEVLRDIQPDYKPQTQYLELCLKAQDNFWEFEKIRMNRPARIDGMDRLFQSHYYNVSGQAIVFNCYNTAWISQRNEKPGQLLMPLDIVPENPQCDLLISLHHHPLNWLQPDNAKAFRKLLERHSNFIMTGHEHEADGHIKYTFDGAILCISEGSVLQEHSSKRSGFVTHILDFDRREFKTATYQRVTDPSSYKSLKPLQEIEWLTLEANPLRSSTQLENTSEHMKTLHDVGAIFSHPAKDKLQLEDLFVYPDFEKRVSGKNAKIEKAISRRINTLLSSENVFSFVKEKNEVLFFGPDRCGKTSLLKKLYIDLAEEGYTPLSLNGVDLTSLDEREFEKAISNAIVEQYGENNLEDYQHTYQAQKVVLVDNFHRVSLPDPRNRNSSGILNVQGQNEMIALLRARFGRIVFLASDVLRFEEFARDNTEQSSLHAFEYCEFREMGHRLRGKLIEKWLTIGREYTSNEQDTLHQIREVENFINTVLGKKLIPSTPFFYPHAFTAARSESVNQHPVRCLRLPLSGNDYDVA